MKKLSARLSILAPIGLLIFLSGIIPGMVTRTFNIVENILFGVGLTLFSIGSFFINVRIWAWFWKIFRMFSGKPGRSI
jgi:hypothetical protein